MHTPSHPDIDRLLVEHRPFTQRLVATFVHRHRIEWMRADLEAVALEAAWETLRKSPRDLDASAVRRLMVSVVWRRCLDAVRVELGRPGTARSAAQHVNVNTVDIEAATTPEREVVGSVLEEDLVALISCHVDELEAEVVLAPLRHRRLASIANRHGVTASRISQVRRSAIDRLARNASVRELLLA